MEKMWFLNWILQPARLLQNKRVIIQYHIAKAPGELFVCPGILFVPITINGSFYCL